MRRIGAIATIGASLLMLAAAGPVLAGSAECELTAEPAEGPPGTEFVFTGSGYTPTRLTLRQAGREPIVQELDLGDADPFEIPLVATEDHAGKWTVIASIPETECAGRAVIHVTLPSTATGSDNAGTDRVAILLGFAGLMATFLFATRSFLGRFAPRV